MFARFTAATGLVLAAAVAFPASAACTIKVLPISVTMEGLSPMIAAKVNDQDVSFLLDSGSAINMIGGKFAAEQKLKPMGVNGIGSRIADDGLSAGSGAAGTTMVNGVVIAPQVTLLGTVFKNVSFVASPRITGASGLIGQSLLHQTDVEYDLAGGLVRLVKPDGCKTTDMVYWAKEGTPYSKVALDWRNNEDTHTRITITVNGVKLLALLDTGAGTSLITEKAAAKAGVRSTDPGVVPTGKGSGVDSDFQTWNGTFANVKIGDEEMKNVPLNIGRSSADFFDVLLGADFFLAHHVYVATSQEQIYFAYTGGPVFRVPAAETQN
jgi:predicted aspartyl protease